MSLFDSASLVVTPNGYKEDKLYSIKPTDGSGDLVVTRATTATRVNSAGLVELVPYNLATYSNTFTNGVWTNLNQTLTANTIANPVNEAVDAYTISLNSGTSSKVVLQSITQIGTYTQSVYVKANTHNFIQLLVGSDTSPYANFDIVNGTYNAYNCTATITNVGNGWFRCTITYTTSTGSAFYIWAVDSLTSARASNSASTGSYYAYGFQLVTGSSAKEYFPTTDRLDVPRLDYTNSTCPSILVEPQRTNLITYSEQFDDASWTKSSSTITANTSIAPTGNATADTLTITSGGYLLKQVVGYSAVSGQSITISIFAKNQITNFLIFGGATASGTDVYTIQDYGNGWYRHIRTRTFTTTATTTIQFAINQIGTHIIWGAQLEAGSYATSYIPTIASSVTRNADVISKTGISSLIGQTEGTIFVDTNISIRSNTRVLLDLQDGTNNDTFQFVLGGNTLTVNIYDGGNIQASLNGGYCLGRKKIALGYKANDFVLYIDGVQVATDTNGTVPTASLMALGYLYIASGYELGDTINSSALWKTRLSNTELATLTTI